MKLNIGILEILFILLIIYRFYLSIKLDSVGPNEASSVRDSIPSLSLIYFFLFYIIVHQFERVESNQNFGAFEILLVLSIFINIWMKFKMYKLALKLDSSITPDEKEFTEVHKNIRFSNLITFILFLIVCHHQNASILSIHLKKYIMFLAVLSILTYMFLKALASVGRM